MRALSPEFRLAAACSIWPPSDDRTDAIREAATGPLDWDHFLRVIRRHRVVGLVHDGLARAKVEVPQDVASDLGEQAVALTQQSLVLAAESLRLQRLFDEADLPVVFIKGAPLAMLAYGNIGLRQSKDLDLLVPVKSVPAAMALVERAGYRRCDPPYGLNDTQLRLLMPMRRDFGYFHEHRKVEIELHWRLLLNPHLLNETSVLASSRIVPLSESGGIRTLAEEDLFAYLCAHGALHWWYQLKWLADVGALLAGASNDDVARLCKAADARGVGRAAAQALLLCQRLLRRRLPDNLAIHLRKNAIFRWLETTAVKSMTAGNSEIEPRHILFGTTRGSLSCFLLSGNWRYWLAELKIHAICETDVLALSLPKQLQFLYPILRLPLWLWRQIAHRGRE